MYKINLEKYQKSDIFIDENIKRLINSNSKFVRNKLCNLLTAFVDKNATGLLSCWSAQENFISSNPELLMQMFPVVGVIALQPLPYLVGEKGISKKRYVVFKSLDGYLRIDAFDLESYGKSHKCYYMSYSKNKNEIFPDDSHQQLLKNNYEIFNKNSIAVKEFVETMDSHELGF